MSDRSRAERDVVRQCYRGLEAPEVTRQVLRSLRRLLPIDAAFFATADPETLLFTGAIAEDPLGTATPLFMQNEFGGNDVNRFAALARSPAHVASLDDATRGDRPASQRYREIMRPLGLGDELRVALVAGSECWGYLCLHREDDPLGFTPAEAAMVAGLAPHIAHALRQAVLLRHSSAAGAAPRPGVVLLDDEHNLVSSTPEAEHLMSLIATEGLASMPLPVAIYTVAAALTQVEKGTAPATTLPSAQVQTLTGGWLNVHAARLTGPPSEQRIAVVVEPADPHAYLRTMLAAHGLTDRERQVATLVLRGTSTRAISDALHISTHTVQDHLKAVFDKTGVRSRRDLVGLLLGPARA